MSKPTPSWLAPAIQLKETGSTYDQVLESLPDPKPTKAALIKGIQRAMKSPEKLTTAVRMRIPTPEVNLTDEQNSSLADIVLRAQKNLARTLELATAVINRNLSESGNFMPSEGEMFRAKLAVESLRGIRGFDGFSAPAPQDGGQMELGLTDAVLRRLDEAESLQ